MGNAIQPPGDGPVKPCCDGAGVLPYLVTSSSQHQPQRHVLEKDATFLSMRNQHEGTNRADFFTPSNISFEMQRMGPTAAMRRLDEAAASLSTSLPFSESASAATSFFPSGKMTSLLLACCLEPPPGHTTISNTSTDVRHPLLRRAATFDGIGNSRKFETLDEALRAARALAESGRFIEAVNAYLKSLHIISEDGHDSHDQQERHTRTDALLSKNQRDIVTETTQESQDSPRGLGIESRFDPRSPKGERPLAPSTNDVTYAGIEPGASPGYEDLHSAASEVLEYDALKGKDDQSGNLEGVFDRSRGSGGGVTDAGTGSAEGGNVAAEAVAAFSIKPLGSGGVHKTSPSNSLSSRWINRAQSVPCDVNIVDSPPERTRQKRRSEATLRSGCSADWFVEPKPSRRLSDALMEQLRASPRSDSEGLQIAVVWDELGGLFFEHRMPAEARLCFLKALSNDHSNANTLYRLGVVNLSEGRAEEALESTQEAIRLAPQYVPALFSRGRIESALNRLEEARQSFKEVLKLDPSSTAAMSMMADTYERQSRFAEAASYLEEAASLDPTNHSIARALKGIRAVPSCDESGHIVIDDCEGSNFSKSCNSRGQRLKASISTEGLTTDRLPDVDTTASRTTTTAVYSEATVDC